MTDNKDRTGQTTKTGKSNSESLVAVVQGWEARTTRAGDAAGAARRSKRTSVLTGSGASHQARPDLRRDSNGVAIGPWTESVQRLNKSFWDRARRRL